MVSWRVNYGSGRIWSCVRMAHLGGLNRFLNLPHIALNYEQLD